MLPEEQGIGAVPACSAKLASVANRLAPAVRPIRIAAVERAAAVLVKQLRAVGFDQLEQLCSSASIWRVSLADLRDQLARDPHPDAAGQPPQPSVDPVELARVSRARLASATPRARGRAATQMPAQPVLHAGALGDEIVAVIGQQPDLHRLLVQVRDRELARRRP